MKWGMGPETKSIPGCSVFFLGGVGDPYLDLVEVNVVEVVLVCVADDLSWL